MDIQHVLHMVGGEGETSYAINSSIQKTGITKAIPMIVDSIVDLYMRTLPKCFYIADLGCGSGPNTLLAITEIIDSIESAHDGTCSHPPFEYHITLNDLPGNDFNSIFKSLPTFYEKLQKEKGHHQLGPSSCFISALPGSFFGRLFPSKSLHFVHSSYALHWLSQVPPGIEDNKGHIYLAKTSPPSVFKGYLEQFQKDFSAFLTSRYEEILPTGGHMVLTFFGRKTVDDFSTDFCCLKELLAKSLNELVLEGLLEESKLDSFNLPVYTPCVEEVRTIIQTEGSFLVQTIEMFEMNWDLTTPDDNDNEEFMFEKFTISAQNIARNLRAVMESLLVQQFGGAIINNLFQRYAKNIAKHLTEENSWERSKYVTLVISVKSRD